MKDFIILSVPKGTQILRSNGSVISLNEVPENALDLIEQGATYLMLKKEAKDQLKKLSKERLIKIIEMRKSQGLKHDISILEMALAEKEAGKETGKSKQEIQEDKTVKS